MNFYTFFLCSFHTSLPLKAMALFSVNVNCLFIVGTLRHCSYGLITEASLPIWIEFNYLQSAAVGKAARDANISWRWISNLLVRCCLPFVHPWVTSGICAAVQISPSSGKVVSGKLVWKQHYNYISLYNPPTWYCFTLTAWISAVLFLVKLLTDPSEFTISSTTSSLSSSRNFTRHGMTNGQIEQSISWMGKRLKSILYTLVTNWRHTFWSLTIFS